MCCPVYSEMVVSVGGFHPYTGSPIDPNGSNIVYKWRLSSAILFTVTILTTIGRRVCAWWRVAPTTGYGHVFPRSDVGRLACILYSIIAIPLTSVFLLRIGAGVGKSVQLLYNRGGGQAGTPQIMCSHRYLLLLWQTTNQETHRRSGNTYGQAVPFRLTRA